MKFIECINRGDVDGLSVLMTDGHTLQVLDEAPLVGRAANVEAWRGYTSAFPNYVIYPHQFAERGTRSQCSDTRPARISGSPITRRRC